MKRSAQNVRVSELNPHLMCVLCGGYYVDATTIIECLHSFCKTCIVNYLDSSKFCPICDVQVHKTKPLMNIRPDHALQELVYKLIPGLFTREILNRQQFYRKNPEALISDTYDRDSPEETSEDPEPSTSSIVGDDTISLSLEFSTDGKAIQRRKSKGKGKNSKKSETILQKRYLLCPAAFTIGHVKKFIRMKFDLSTSLEVDVFHVDEPLSDSYALLDIAYLYMWNKNEPFPLFFSVYTNTVKRPKVAVTIEEVVPEPEVIVPKVEEPVAEFETPQVAKAPRRSSKGGSRSPRRSDESKRPSPKSPHRSEDSKGSRSPRKSEEYKGAKKPRKSEEFVETLSPAEDDEPGPSSIPTKPVKRKLDSELSAVDIPEKTESSVSTVEEPKPITSDEHCPKDTSVSEDEAEDKSRALDELFTGLADRQSNGCKISTGSGKSIVVSIPKHLIETSGSEKEKKKKKHKHRKHRHSRDERDREGSSKSKKRRESRESFEHAKSDNYSSVSNSPASESGELLNSQSPRDTDTRDNKLDAVVPNEMPVSPAGNSQEVNVKTSPKDTSSGTSDIDSKVSKPAEKSTIPTESKPVCDSVMDVTENNMNRLDDHKTSLDASDDQKSSSHSKSVALREPVLQQLQTEWDETRHKASISPERQVEAPLTVSTTSTPEDTQTKPQNTSDSRQKSESPKLKPSVSAKHDSATLSSSKTGQTKKSPSRSPSRSPSKSPPSKSPSKSPPLKSPSKSPPSKSPSKPSLSQRDNSQPRKESPTKIYPHKEKISKEPTKLQNDDRNKHKSSGHKGERPVQVKKDHKPMVPGAQVNTTHQKTAVVEKQKTFPTEKQKPSTTEKPKIVTAEKKEKSPQPKQNHEHTPMAKQKSEHQKHGPQSPKKKPTSDREPVNRPSNSPGQKPTSKEQHHRSTASAPSQAKSTHGPINLVKLPTTTTKDKPTEKNESVAGHRIVKQKSPDAKVVRFQKKTESSLRMMDVQSSAPSIVSTASSTVVPKSNLKDSSSRKSSTSPRIISSPPSASPRRTSPAPSASPRRMSPAPSVSPKITAPQSTASTNITSPTPPAIHHDRPETLNVPMPWRSLSSLAEAGRKVQESANNALGRTSPCGPSTKMFGPSWCDDMRTSNGVQLPAPLSAMEQSGLCSPTFPDPLSTFESPAVPKGIKTYSKKDKVVYKSPPTFSQIGYENAFRSFLGRPPHDDFLVPRKPLEHSGYPGSSLLSTHRKDKPPPHVPNAQRQIHGHKVIGQLNMVYETIQKPSYSEIYRKSPKVVSPNKPFAYDKDMNSGQKKVSPNQAASDVKEVVKGKDSVENSLKKNGPASNNSQSEISTKTTYTLKDSQASQSKSSEKLSHSAETSSVVDQRTTVVEAGPPPTTKYVVTKVQPAHTRCESSFSATHLATSPPRQGHMCGASSPPESTCLKCIPRPRSTSPHMTSSAILHRSFSMPPPIMSPPREWPHVGHTVCPRSVHSTCPTGGHSPQNNNLSAAASLDQTSPCDQCLSAPILPRADPNTYDKMAPQEVPLNLHKPRSRQDN